MSKQIGKKTRVNCLTCSHYYITWDKNFPMGCRALDFKTRYFPANVVYRASGIECQYYRLKDKTDNT